MEAGIKMKVWKTKLKNSQKVEQEDQEMGNRRDSNGGKIKEVELQLIEFPKKNIIGAKSEEEKN